MRHQLPWSARNAFVTAAQLRVVMVVEPTRRTGLAGLADRAEAIGGNLALPSPPGRELLLTASIRYEV